MSGKGTSQVIGRQLDMTPRDFRAEVIRLDQTHPRPLVWEIEGRVFSNPQAQTGPDYCIRGECDGGSVRYEVIGATVHETFVRAGYPGDD
ncbi:MAG: hypothetical protein ACOX0Z_01385 [Candidatus Nanosyncoccaceae bacterium]|jgi:hypothetical protein